MIGKGVNDDVFLFRIDNPVLLDPRKPVGIQLVDQILCFCSVRKYFQNQRRRAHVAPFFGNAAFQIAGHEQVRLHDIGLFVIFLVEVNIKGSKEDVAFFALKKFIEDKVQAA